MHERDRVLANERALVVLATFDRMRHVLHVVETVVDEAGTAHADMALPFGRCSDQLAGQDVTTKTIGTAQEVRCPQPIWGRTRAFGQNTPAVALDNRPVFTPSGVLGVREQGSGAMAELAGRGHRSPGADGRDHDVGFLEGAASFGSNRPSVPHP